MLVQYSSPIISNAGGGQTFDFYISTTGSNSNPGTLASPWALTAINAKQSTYAGKRVGVLPGTYDCTGIMNTTQGAALQINGAASAPARTYIGSSNASGYYQVGTAILDCKASSGFYGGSNSNISYLLGTTVGGGLSGPTPANWGNWTIDGLSFTGFSDWCVVVGDNSGAGGAVPNVSILNCAFYDSDMGNVTGNNPNTTHPGPLECYYYTNLLISNCILSNNKNSSAGANQTHFQGITLWGGLTPGSSRSESATIQYCTFLSSGGIYGIADTGIISGTTIQYNYFDMTNSTSGPPLPQWVAIFGFGNHLSDNPSSMHHNICVGGTFIDTGPPDQWGSACSIYNNTWDIAGGAGKGGTNPLGFRFWCNTGLSALFTCYNNLMYDNGWASGMQYGYNVSNVDGFALCDYNIYGTNTTNKFGSAPSGGSSVTVEYTTLASWATAIGGLEAHSSTNSTNPFTNAGTYAAQYTVTSGPAYQTGRVGGTSGGAVCNVGAWDGTVTQIGSTLPVPP